MSKLTCGVWAGTLSQKTATALKETNGPNQFDVCACTHSKIH